MAVSMNTITFDCADAARLAEFWAAVTGWDVAPDPTAEFAAVGGPQRPRECPSLMFIQVPEPKAAKNRCHLDLAADDLDAERARLELLGAERVHDKEEWGARWTTFADPEGNEFCISLHHEL